MTFAQRAIDVELTLGEGPLGDTPGTPIRISGHRVQCAVASYGGATQSALQIRIYGLSLDLMNRMTVIGAINGQARKNQIRVMAGNKGGPLAMVFEGTTNTVWADMDSQPEVSLNIIGVSAGMAAAMPVPPTTWPGKTDVAVIMKAIAAFSGYAFENSGVSVSLQDQYLPGTCFQQLQKAATAAQINFELAFGTVAIWPWKKERAGAVIPISSRLGMKGYPVYSSKDMLVTTEFNPEIFLGRRIQVESDMTPANGQWNVYSVSHELDAEIPNGNWFTVVRGVPVPT